MANELRYIFNLWILYGFGTFSDVLKSKEPFKRLGNINVRISSFSSRIIGSLINYYQLIDSNQQYRRQFVAVIITPPFDKHQK